MLRPTCCDSTTRRNSRLHRLRALVCDQPDGIVERQAGFDRAHDDVERVRKFIEELVLAALDQETDDPARQAETGDDGNAENDQHGCAGEQGDEHAATRPKRR